MSKIGYIANAIGQQFNMAVTNTSGETLLANSNGLIKRALIVAADNDDTTATDTGTYALIATDTDGTPVRLTYTMIEGNGLYVNGDKMYMSIDGKTLMSNNAVTGANNELYVEMNNLVDGKTIQTSTSSYGHSAHVNTQNLDKATSSTLGVVKIDNNTINIDSTGKISVNTTNLVKSNDNTYGVVKVDNNSIISNDGVISVNQYSYIMNSIANIMSRIEKLESYHNVKVYVEVDYNISPLNSCTISIDNLTNKYSAGDIIPANTTLCVLNIKSNYIINTANININNVELLSIVNSSIIINTDYTVTGKITININPQAYIAAIGYYALSSDATNYVKVTNNNAELTLASHSDNIYLTIYTSTNNKPTLITYSSIISEFFNNSWSEPRKLTAASTTTINGSTWYAWKTTEMLASSDTKINITFND